MLQVRHFTIHTDHKPLTSTFHQKGDKCSPRHFNHLDPISQFTVDIRHISGQDNIVADTLSRVEAITAPTTHDAFLAAQDDDEELRTPLLRNVSQQLEKLFISGTSVQPFCDTSAGKPRPVVPYPLRRQVFSSLILSATPQIRQRLSSSPNASCGQPFKRLPHLGPSLPTLPPFQSFSPHHHSIWRLPPPTAHFLHIHTDLVDPLPSSEGFQYCFTAVDRFTRRLEAFRIPDITAETVMRSTIRLDITLWLSTDHHD